MSPAAGAEQFVIAFTAQIVLFASFAESSSLNLCPKHSRSPPTLRFRRAAHTFAALVELKM